MKTRLVELIRRHPLLTFFALSYILSWSFWLPESVWPERDNGLATWLGNCGPAIAGALVVAVTLGAAGLRDLLARLFRWRVPLLWYVVALMLPIGLQIVNVGVYAATGNLASDYDPGVWSANLPQIIPGFVLGTLFGLLASAGEEAGWRGYAVPTLLRRRGPLATSLLVGVVWGFWHFAPYQVPADGPDWGFALLFIVGTTSAAVFYTWLYIHTRGSLIIASLFHSSYNMTAMTVMAGIPISVFPGYVAIFVLASLIIIVTNKWIAWRATPHLRHA